MGQAVCLNNPRGNHLAKLLVSKQFTSLVFKRTPPQALCLVPGRGLASLLPGPAQRPAPTPGGPKQAAAHTSLQTTLEVALMSICQGRGPGPWSSLHGCPRWPGPGWRAPRLCAGHCLLRPSGRQARPRLFPGGPVLSRQNSSKNLKGSAAQGCRRHSPAPALESINTYRFIPEFNYCLSHRDLILRNAENGVP